MQRNVLVDRLKGYACFLVLFGHVIMGIRLAGINIPHFFEGMEKFIWSFHVALFMFLSGVVYKETGEWKNKKTKRGFLLYKLCSLGIPYIVFSAVYIGINSFVGQTNNQSTVVDVLYIWETPVAQYWFLYALFFLFVIWTTFSGIIENWIITLIVVVVGYAVPFLGINLGSFEVVFYTALPFGLGTVVDFSSLVKPPRTVKCITVLMHMVVGAVLVVLQKIEDPIMKEVMIVLGIGSSIALISILQKYTLIRRFLDFMNKYSFQIYLLHTIFTAGLRIVLMRMHITSWWIHILIGTVGGIVFSVLAAEIARRIPFLNFFFFPTKYLYTKKHRASKKGEE